MNIYNILSNSLNRTIIETLLINNKITIKNLSIYLRGKKTNTNPITYEKVRRRVNLLINLGILVKVYDKPLIFKIEPSLYEDLKNMIESYYNLQEKWRIKDM